MSFVLLISVGLTSCKDEKDPGSTPISVTQIYLRIINQLFLTAL